MRSDGRCSRLLVLVLTARVPAQPLLVELDDHLRKEASFSFSQCSDCDVSLTWGHFMFACLAATRSASSLPFHLMRNMSSPLLSVAPMILSAWRPRSKPRGRRSSPGWSFLLPGSAPSSPLTEPPFLLDCSFFSFSVSSNALISSGQSRFSFGSQVFSSGPKPCHWAQL